jgi:hypothetical protein
MGVIVNQGLPSGVDLNRQAVHRLPPNLRESLAGALQTAFLAAAALSVVVLVIVAVWLKEVPLRKGLEDEPVEVAVAVQPEVQTQQAR